MQMCNYSSLFSITLIKVHSMEEAKIHISATESMLLFDDNDKDMKY